MSDIEILLRELLDKVEDLEKKVDRIERQVVPPVFNVVFDQPTRYPELKVGDTCPNPYEIKCKGEDHT